MDAQPPWMDGRQDAAQKRQPWRSAAAILVARLAAAAHDEVGGLPRRWWLMRGASFLVRLAYAFARLCHLDLEGLLRRSGQ